MAVYQAGPEPGVMRVADVARILGVHEQTVKAEIRRGRLRCVHVGRVIRITDKHLAEYLEGDPS